MKINNPVAYAKLLVPRLAFSIILIFTSVATAQTKAITSPKPPSSPEISVQLNELQKLRKENEDLQKEILIRELIHTQVNDAFGHTTTLINILLIVLTVLPILAGVSVWLFRRSVISQLASQTKYDIKNELKEQIEKDLKEHIEKELTAEMKKQIKPVAVELQKQIGREVEKQLEKEVNLELQKQIVSQLRNDIQEPLEIAAKQLKHEILAELQPQTADAKQEVERLNLELSKLFELQEQLAEELKKQTAASKKEIEKLTSELLSEISQLQITKNDIIRQLDVIIPVSMRPDIIPEEFVTDEEYEILEKLTSQLEILQDANPELPFSTNDYLKQGDACFLARRYEEAIKYYDSAIQKQPDNYIAWVNRGRPLRRIGCYEEALFSYKKAIKIKIDYSMAWFGCGHALRDLERYDEAIYCYNKCLEIQPDFHWVWYTKARYHALQGNIDLALESLNEAIELIGDRYTELAKTEPLFDPLREDIRFQKLIAS